MARHPRCLLFGGILLMAVAQGNASAAVFEVRGWDIERYDPDYVVKMIHKAHAAGMNTISLSHEVVMNAEEILWDWHRYKHLRRFCDEAHDLGMSVYLWNHQVNNPPEDLIVRDPETGRRQLRFDDPGLVTWLEDRYERVVERVPDFDGIILSLTESEWQIHRQYGSAFEQSGFRPVLSDLPPDERMARVINAIHGVLHRHGKRLIVRDFLRTPAEMDAFARAMKRVPDDVWVFTKCVPNDWQYRYPPHPLLGKVAPHPQIMELDLYNETSSGIGMYMPGIEYVRDQLRLARDRGLVGAIGRCDDGFGSNVGTPGEASVFAYSRLLHDPDLDPALLWREFFVPFYGEKAAPVAIDVLKESFEIVCAIRYTLGFWTGGVKSTVRYTDGHLLNHSTAVWSDDPKYEEIERFLDVSGPLTINAVVKEKREAEERARRCLAKLDAAEGRFEPGEFAQLRPTYVRAVSEARAHQEWARTYFALRWYRNTGSGGARRALDEALASCRAFVAAAGDDDALQATRLERFAAEVEGILGESALRVRIEPVEIPPDASYPHPMSVRILPPWDQEGAFVLRSPETLGSDAGLLFIDHDRPDMPAVTLPTHPLRWELNEDGSLAYRCELEMGVVLTAKLTPGRDDVSIVYSLENHAGRPLGNMGTQFCFIENEADAFADPRAERTFIVVNGEFQALGATRPGLSAGETQPLFIATNTKDREPFYTLTMERSWTAAVQADLPLIALVSKDGSRVVGLTFDNAYKIMTNCEIPCMHADPMFDDCPDGGCVEIRGRVYFVEGGLGDLLARFRRDFPEWAGEGASPNARTDAGPS